VKPHLVYLVTEDWYFVSHRLVLAEAARAAGWEVTVVTRCTQAWHEIEAAGIAVVPLAMDRRGLNPYGLAREVVALARIYRRLRPDVVHHVALRPVVVGSLAARLARVSRVISAIAGLGYVWTERSSLVSGGSFGWLRLTLGGVLRLALARGAVIVQNPDDLEAVAALGVARQRLHLIPGAGVDVSRFTHQPEPDGMPVVLMASRLLRDKGVAEFVAAARALRGRARFVLAGAPDEGNPASVTADELAAWVREGAIDWWGSRANMPEVLSQAHIVCLPSSYREGLPKVLLEAMACGRACVTTDTPGCRDAVRHGDNGLLVPERDAEALAAAIGVLLENAPMRHKMGARGRERAIAEFSTDRVITATLALYPRPVRSGETEVR